MTKDYSQDYSQEVIDSFTGDSYAPRRSYPNRARSALPTRSCLSIDDVGWASTKGSSAGSSKSKRYAADGVSSYESKSRIIATYGASSWDKVVIYEPLNPWKVLGFHSSGVSFWDVKAAFKMKITQTNRQNRAMISIAYHMLTSSPGRYTRKRNTDEYIVGRHDNFILAACGHTEKLALEIAKRGNVVEEKDEYGRTLLYTASQASMTHASYSCKKAPPSMKCK